VGESDKLYVLFDSPEAIREYFEDFYKCIQSWVKRDLEREGKQYRASITNWREAWSSERVQVWVRFDNNNQPISKALDWLHLPSNRPEALKKTHLSGEMGTIGRIWQRMYPGFKQQNTVRQAPAPGAAWARHVPGVQRSTQRKCIEFLTIFPEPNAQDQNKRKQDAFLNFLKNQSDFEQVW
jgi:CRISPR-associated protein Cmr6